MAVISAGILIYRHGRSGLEVLLVHPGGPFWARKDLGAWSIPKGLAESDEDVLAAAKREFEEETGLCCPESPAIDLGEVRLASGKRVHAWAVEGDFALESCRSNAFSLEWPPKSGKQKEFPEVDQWRYFAAEEGREKLNKNQAVLIDRLLATVSR
jgi:predicted NUDIX family NTP pyrophosphohydrolase